jgi:hypothetical protein
LVSTAGGGKKAGADGDGRAKTTDCEAACGEDVTVWRWTASVLTRHPWLTVAGAMLASTLLTWAPFLEEPSVLYSYWDGPHYVYLAKTLYAVPADHPFTPYGLTAAYYATHLPAYPLLIRLLVPLTLGRYLPAMLLATLLASTTAAVLFYELLRRSSLVRAPLWTAVVFAFLPPRWVIYHSVGASEPLFLVFVMAAFLAYRADRSAWLVLFIGLASLTRIMGVLMIPAFVLTCLWQRRLRQAALVPLAGLAVLALFTWHYALYGNFLAYFTRNVVQAGHVSAAPLLALRSYAGAGDAHDAELYLGLYAVFGIGAAALWKHRPLFCYSLAFLLFTAFVFHYDLSRMFIPIAPFALLVAYDAVLSLPACRVALPLLVWLDCIYAWGLIPGNGVAPFVFRALERALS